MDLLPLCNSTLNHWVAAAGGRLTWQHAVIGWQYLLARRPCRMLTCSDRATSRLVKGRSAHPWMTTIVFYLLPNYEETRYFFENFGPNFWGKPNMHGISNIEEHGISRHGISRIDCIPYIIIWAYKKTKSWKLSMRPAITLLPFELQTHLKKVFQLLISSVEWSEVIRQYWSRSAPAIQVVGSYYIGQ